MRDDVAGVDQPNTGEEMSVVTMREVAARAGVSTKTVSRVINNDRYISAAVQERVQQAVAEMHYVPSALARTFRSGRDTAIGVAVPDLGDELFAGIVRRVERIARERATVVLVTSLTDDPAQEQPAVEALLNRQISGLIIAPTGVDHSYLKSWLGQVGIVFVDRPPLKLSVDSIIEDDLGGAAAAVSALVASGHRRIAFLGPSSTVVTVRRRLQGYRAALAAAGLPEDTALLSFYVDEAISAVEACAALLKLPNPPTALFSANSATSIEVVPLLHELGRTDVALASFGDFPMAGTLHPSITVVDQRPDELGRIAAQRLFQRIDEPTARLKKQVKVPVSLLERESSRLPGPAAAHRLRA
jgi:LacI family transcriptional regulator